MHEAQKLGATFTDEQLLAVGDPDVCSRQIEELLFGEGKTHDFAKAKDLILRTRLPQEKLSEYAQRYYDIYQMIVRCCRISVTCLSYHLIKTMSN
jgi:hypothetical protein